jgi:hypothetical protein
MAHTLSVARSGKMRPPGTSHLSLRAQVSGPRRRREEAGRKGQREEEEGD